MLDAMCGTVLSHTEMVIHSFLIPFHRQMGELISAMLGNVALILAQGKQKFQP